MLCRMVVASACCLRLGGRVSRQCAWVRGWVVSLGQGRVVTLPASWPVLICNAWIDHSRRLLEQFTPNNITCLSKTLVLMVVAWWLFMNESCCVLSEP
jgi:hypothetical protein